MGLLLGHCVYVVSPEREVSHRNFIEKKVFFSHLIRFISHYSRRLLCKRKGTDLFWFFFRGEKKKKLGTVMEQRKTLANSIPHWMSCGYVLALAKADQFLML